MEFKYNYITENCYLYINQTKFELFYSSNYTLFLPPIVCLIDTIARKPFRGVNSRLLAGIGLLGGVTYASISSLQRFIGLESNSREVELYGIISPEGLLDYQRKSNIPNYELIDSSEPRK